jgi:hypothetical protein
VAKTTKPATKPGVCAKPKSSPSAKAKTKPAPIVPVDGEVLLPAKRKGGQQSAYTPALASEILERLSNGEPLNLICKDAHMPHERTVRRWRDDDVHGFADRFARAVDSCLEAWACEVISIADEEAPDQASVQRNRLRVDARKWTLSKLRPERYGDRVDFNVTNKTEQLSAEHIETKLAALLGLKQPGGEVITLTAIEETEKALISRRN